MKRSVGLIILLALSFGNSVAQLILQSKKRPTLEQDVSDTLKNMWKSLNDIPDLSTIPDWLMEGFLTCVKHYQDFGVQFFHLKTGVYYITIIAVILMFLWKKGGFWLYVLAQILTVGALFFGFGFNILSVLGAVLVSLVCYLFIWLYKKKFLLALENNSPTHP